MLGGTCCRGSVAFSGLGAILPDVMSQPALDNMIAIADAFDRGAFAALDSVDTDTIARAVGLPSKSVSRLLRRLGVSQLSPATWAPPLNKDDWPALFLEQRTLRRNGVPVSTIYQITDAAAGVDGIVQMAMEQLNLSGIPYDQRGALRRQIPRVIKDIYLEWLKADNEVRSAERQDQDQAVDWPSVAMLPPDRLRNFARIATRVAASGTNANPGAYALRWVLENQGRSGTDLEVDDTSDLTYPGT